MNTLTATTLLESLAFALRLDIYRLLVKTGPEGLVAGEIGARLDVPPTNLSFHLKALTQAGMLTVESQGRYQRYRANMPLMLDLIAFLTEECCAGQPEHCVDLSAVAPCTDERRPSASAPRSAGAK